MCLYITHRLVIGWRWDSHVSSSVEHAVKAKQQCQSGGGWRASNYCLYIALQKCTNITIGTNQVL